ncbi:MAG: response regulator [Candidatus Thorarchaeota archaeon]|jgi:DNA-binding NtrC family response regulator
MARLVTRVLLVDDDIELLDIARILLDQKTPDIEIVTASSVKEALAKLDEESCDVIISDYLMPDSTGLDLLEALRSAGDEVGFVIWTGQSEEEVAIRALNLGADRYILKSSDYRDQFSLIREIVHDIVLQKEEQQTSPSMISATVVSEFIHKLSHDVAGIAHNIMGYATLLEEGHNQEYLDGIIRLIDKLNARIKQSVSIADEGSLEKLSQT